MGNLDGIWETAARSRRRLARRRLKVSSWSSSFVAQERRGGSGSVLLYVSTVLTGRLNSDDEESSNIPDRELGTLIRTRRGWRAGEDGDLLLAVMVETD